MNRLFHTKEGRERVISRATILAQEQERNRISSELHDNVKQLMVTAQLYIGMAKKLRAGKKEKLEKAEEYLDMAIEATRILTRKLSTYTVKHEGLLRSLERIIVVMRSLQIEVEVHVCEELVLQLSEEQQLMLYRILQEQTNNILKYAGSPRAEISLIAVGDMAELTITDFGKGFDRESQPSSGIGFINIFNRAAALNGTAEITSAPGKGCTLHLSFPIAGEAA